MKLGDGHGIQVPSAPWWRGTRHYWRTRPVVPEPVEQDIVDAPPEREFSSLYLTCVIASTSALLAILVQAVGVSDLYGVGNSVRSSFAEPGCPHEQQQHNEQTNLHQPARVLPNNLAFFKNQIRGVSPKHLDLATFNTRKKEKARARHKRIAL